MQTAVIDYDVGNLASVLQGLAAAGLEPVLTRDRQEILAARAVVLPGVGAFPRGMENLRELGLLPVIAEAAERGIALLGICLGMQLLFEEGEEYGRHRGLGLLPGRVVGFPTGLKVPHMGWNTLKVTRPHPLLHDIRPGSYVYFVHSYRASGCAETHVTATTHYDGTEIPAVVCSGNIMGIQFHPEKSSGVGLQILRNFGGLVRNGSYSGH